MGAGTASDRARLPGGWGGQGEGHGGRKQWLCKAGFQQAKSHLSGLPAPCTGAGHLGRLEEEGKKKVAA